MRRVLLVASFVVATACGTLVGAPAADTSVDAGDDGGVEAATDAADAADAAVASPGALAFVAASLQYVDCPSIVFSTDFTLEMWVRPHSRGNEMLLASEDTAYDPDNQFRLGIRDTGEVYFGMSDQSSSSFGLIDLSDAAGAYALHSGRPVDVDFWTHVAVVKSSATFALALNGVSVSRVTASSATFTRNSTSRFRIGAQTDQDGGGDATFDGAIDDVRLYRVARTIEQVNADMRTEIGPASDGWADLVSYWRFDEGAGTVAHDDTHRYDGTLVGGPTWIAPGAF